ncbi:hypothetical protein [Serratia sp. 2723]|uniref:hypothetical protein n=1 Tax=unclassified Serratia (in: enterobacteria) TaxID=2647522 RepID=UPI003D209C6A
MEDKQRNDFWSISASCHSYPREQSFYRAALSWQTQRNFNLSPFVLYGYACCRQFETFNLMILINKKDFSLTRRFKATGSVTG